MGHTTTFDAEAYKEVKAVLAEKDEEIKQLHLTISRQAEAYKEEMRKELDRIDRSVDRLEEKLEHYNSIINLHNNLGGKDEFRKVE